MIGDIRERIGPRGVPVRAGVGQCADSTGVQDAHDYAWHTRHAVRTAFEARLPDTGPGRGAFLPRALKIASVRVPESGTPVRQAFLIRIGRTLTAPGVEQA